VAAGQTDWAVSGTAGSDRTTTKTGSVSDGVTSSGVIVTVNPTFSYDPQAQRVVMLTRDRKTGAVDAQMPSEMALRQYEQAAKRTRETAAAAQSSGGATAGATAAGSQGVVVPFGTKSGSTTVGATSGRGGGARYNVVV
jgi:hypothetical protein